MSSRALPKSKTTGQTSGQSSRSQLQHQRGSILPLHAYGLHSLQGVQLLRKTPNHHHVASTQLPADHYIRDPLHENIHHPIPPLCRRTGTKVQLLGGSKRTSKRRIRVDLAGGPRRSDGKARTRLQCRCGLPNIVRLKATSYEK